MHDWLGQLTDRLAVEEAVATVTCLTVSGSAPCAPGSRMIVCLDELVGTIGGGNLEFLAIDQARKLLELEERARVQSLPLGPMLAQCCGGRVTLLYERFTPSDLGFFAAAAQADGMILTRCKPETYGKWLVCRESITSIDGNEAPDLEPPSAPGQFDGDYWRESTGSAKPQVCIFGAGHVGKALAQVLSVMDCDVLVIDPRAEVASQILAGTSILHTDDPSSMSSWWRKGAVAVVLTHSHELDYTWISAILRRGDSSFCGLIGSKTKRARFLRRLRADGLDDHQIDHLTCPIGLSGLNSKDPGAVAVSTAAQLLPLLATLSHARAGQSCECALPGETLHMEHVQ